MRRDTKSSSAGTTKVAAASHDTLYPPALLAFMMRNWRTGSRKLPPKVVGLTRFVARRKLARDAHAQDVLVVPTGREKVRANDTNYRFRPGTDFYYLTGNLEPDCVLLLLPKGMGPREILFAEPNPGRADSTFFTDRNKGELWVGPRLGIAQSKHRYGMQHVQPLAELPAFLQQLKKQHGERVRVLRGIDPTIDAQLPARPEQDRALGATLSEMRLVKDSSEIAAMRRVCASTRRGFEDVIGVLAHAKTEREVEGTFNLRARVEGNDVGYGTIAASGAHACILHWTHNDGALRKNELLLLDAGVEGRTLYTADVTRTLPIGGKFSREQRQIYDLVLQAQAAGIAAVKPGNDFMAPNVASMAVLAHGLVALGILKTTAQEALRAENLFYKRYTLHNVSHMLGLDVHDCAQARQKTYKYGALKPGMILTVEPGLYFQKDDLTVPARFRGIGVRIEDDVLVTRRGCEILSDLPRTAGDVEKWMREVWRRKK